jgi:hypothetical protein
MKKLYSVQSIVLAAGTIFAWYTVYTDFLRFSEIEGTIFKINDCLVPNPVLTPCFYGAIAFLISFIWSITILKKKSEKRGEAQKKLQILLIAATIFAWSNFFYEVYRWFSRVEGEQFVGCSGALAANPMYTACFYGSVIYLIALIISLVLVRKEKKPLT